MYYYPNEIKADLERYPKFKEKLYCRGFILTDKRILKLNDYPFYNNWHEIQLRVTPHPYYIYIHKNAKCYVLEKENAVLFLVGHAYNPYSMVVDENEILLNLYDALQKGEAAFWEEESKLTGVFFIGFIEKNTVTFSTDCAGMQLVYSGTIKGHLFASSHSKLIADLEGLEQSKYIKRLTASRFWKWWGCWLPADLSPFNELLRLNPNCKSTFDASKKAIHRERYYPIEAIRETSTEQEFQKIIRELAHVMSNNMACIAKKWPEKKIGISVTGGKDSMTTLACTRDHYEDFSYFSYISNVDESVDAYAAQKILAHLGLKHTIHKIPDNCNEYEGIEIFKKVMQCNNGCIGENNLNDIKKRMYFAAHPPCDIEVKSWVNETGRAWEYNKYNKKRFPRYPYPAYWRAMHKVYLDPRIIKETDKAFKDYLDRYYSKSLFDRLSWLELYFWEFACSACEGSILTSEHRVSYEITIPFNNRKYIETMMMVPVEKRKIEGIPNAIITYMEPRIIDTGIAIHDISHTNLRANILRIYLNIFSKIRF